MAYIRTVAGSGGTVDIDTTNNKATATTTSTTYSPDTDKVFADFTVEPQQHDNPTKYKPKDNTANNDMGAIHNYRYVDTSNMYLVDQGVKELGTISGPTGTPITRTGLEKYSGIKFTIPTPAAPQLKKVTSSAKSSRYKQTIDVTQYVSNYSSLTADNFYIIPTTFTWAEGSDAAAKTFSKSYNSSTGVLTINKFLNQCYTIKKSNYVQTAVYFLYNVYVSG